MAALTEIFTTLYLQQILRFLDLQPALQQLHSTRTLIIATIMAESDRIVSAPKPPLTVPLPSGPKLLVIRFLEAHLAHGGLERHSYDMLYRMIMMVSALGDCISGIVQTDVVQSTVLPRMEWYARCISEGCDVFQRHFETRGLKAQEATERLPVLAGVSDDKLDYTLSIWSLSLRRLHLPTGNDARLFRHLANHYDDAVYCRLLQIHRASPENDVWRLREALTTLQQQLEDLHEVCTAADMVVEALEKEHAAASCRVNREKSFALQPKPKKVTAAPSQPPKATTSSEMAARAYPMTSPISDEPPRLPPLPFETVVTVPTKPMDPRAVQSATVSRRPSITQSFSTVEAEVSRRSSHFRNATISETGYVAQPYGLGIGNLPLPDRGPTIGARRKGSSSAVPRIFTGSFSELEDDIHKLKIHKVETPEQPASPVEYSGPETAQHVKVRDFADSPEDASGCPSPATLQRREAVVSKEAQWESRLLNGEVVHSRRPPATERQEPRSHTLDDRNGGLAAWIGAELQKAQSMPDTPRRGTVRQRENTL